jgi:hypothetical protein
LFKVEHDVSQIVEAVAKDAFSSTPMLLELQQFDLAELLLRVKLDFVICN